MNEISFFSFTLSPFLRPASDGHPRNLYVIQRTEKQGFQGIPRAVKSLPENNTQFYPSGKPLLYIERKLIATNLFVIFIILK